MSINKLNISVIMITYKHENFIKEAIEGVLNQKFKGEIELVIADDCSPDNTKSIVKKCIKANNNNKISIKYTKHKQNKGMNPNFFWALNQCEAKYIAICEGDDYWTDPHKLQRQVDFLEANNDYIVAAENSIWRDLSTNEDNFFSDLPERDVTAYEMLEGRKFATASILFRKEAISKNMIEGDIGLFCYLSKFGKIKYFDVVSSVYHFHSAGVTHMDKLKWAKKMEQWNRNIKNLNLPIDNKIFNIRNFGEYKKVVLEANINKQYKRFLFASLKCIQFKPKQGIKDFLVVLRDWIISKIK